MSNHLTLSAHTYRQIQGSFGRAVKSLGALFKERAKASLEFADNELEDSGESTDSKNCC